MAESGSADLEDSGLQGLVVGVGLLVVQVAWDEPVLV